MFSRFFAATRHKKPEEMKLLDNVNLQFPGSSLELEEFKDKVTLDVRTDLQPIEKIKAIQQKLLTLQSEHKQKPPCSYTRLYQSKLWIIYDFIVSGAASGVIYGITVMSQLTHHYKQKMEEIDADYYDTLHGNQTCYQINNNTVINSLCPPQPRGYVPDSLPTLSSLTSVLDNIKDIMPLKDLQQMCQNLLKQYCDAYSSYNTYSGDLVPLGVLLLASAGYIGYRRHSNQPLLAKNALTSAEISLLKSNKIIIGAKSTALAIAKEIVPLISSLECGLTKDTLSIVQDYLINSKYKDADAYNYIASMRAFS